MSKSHISREGDVVFCISKYSLPTFLKKGILLGRVIDKGMDYLWKKNKNENTGNPK